MKYLFIAFLFISSFTYSQGIEPSSFQPTPYLGGVLRGITPFVDEFTGQTYYLYVHDSLDAAVPYVDTIFMTDFNLYYIKNGDTIYVGSVTDSSFIYNVVSDTFALDMDIDSTNELQELYHEDNILVLTGAGPDSQVDLTPYMDVDSIYMENYDLWYTKSGESGTPRFVGNVTDSSYILSVVSDSSTVVENDYGTIIVESPANTFGVTVDSTKFFSTYAGSLKENAITAGTNLQYWRGDKTFQTLNTSIVPELTNLYYTDARARAALSLTVSGSSGASTYNNTTGVLNVPTYTLAGLGGFALPSLTSGSVLFSDGSTIAQDNTNFFWNNSPNQLGIGNNTPNTYIYDNYPGLSIYGSTTARLALTNSTTNWLHYLLSGDYRIYNSTFGEVFKISSSTGKWQGGAYSSTGTNKAAYFDTGGVLQRGDYDVLDGIGIAGYVARWADTNTQSTGGLYFPSEGAMQMGLGTTNPNGYTGDSHPSLAIYGATSARFALANSSGSWLQYLDGTGFKLWNNSWGDLLTATSTGRIGINTTSPSVSFHVAGNSRFTGSVADGNNDVGSSGQVLSSTVSGTDWIDLPAGDITAVTVSAPVTGGGTSGSVNIAVDTTDATSAALATQFDLLGKQATLVSGTNIKTVNSNSLVGSGDVSVGTVQSITVNAPLTTTQAPITTTATLGVDTTATTGSALATQFDISSKVSGSGTDNYIPRFNGTTAIENSNMYDDGTNIGIGNTSPSRKLHVTGEARITDLTTDITPTVIIGADANGVLESLALSNLSIPGGTTLKGTGFRVNGTGSFNSGDLNLAYGMSGTYPTWAYSSGDFTFRLPTGSSGQVLKHDGTGWAAGTDASGGITTLNGLTGASQSFAVANSGTYFAWNSATTTHTLRLPAGTIGQVLKHDGTSWSAGTDNNTGMSSWLVSANGTAGTGTVSNGATVSLAGTAGLFATRSTTALTIGISDGGVTSAKILDGSVALADMASTTGPNVLGRVSGTSGTPTYNTIGTGIEYNSNQLTATTSHYGFLSDADGSVTSFGINTTPVKVNFDTPLTGLAGTMTVSSTNDNITVTAAGGYEINYGVCISGVASTRQISITIYKNGSSQAPTKKSFFVTSGDEDCASGSHIMILNASDVIDLRIATSGAETVTLTGPQLSLKRLY